MTASRAGRTPGPARTGKPLERQCPRCGGAGTHYLTCPSLRLPPGYRLTADPRPERAGLRREPVVADASGRYLASPRGGPGHRDWPGPPRR